MGKSRFHLPILGLPSEVPERVSNKELLENVSHRFMSVSNLVLLLKMVNIVVLN